MGGIKIVSGGSRHRIEKKLEDLKRQKNEGHITLEEYDTLRLRYERKLGNNEEVSRLQKLKGFEPHNSKNSSKELFDEFVDRSSTNTKGYDELKQASKKQGRNMKKFLLIFIVLAFVIGIVAGAIVLSTMGSGATSTSNASVFESAFSINSTNISANNTTANATNNTTVAKKTTKSYSTTSNDTISSSKSYKTSNSKTSSSSNNKGTTLSSNSGSSSSGSSSSSSSSSDSSSSSSN